MKFSAFKSYTVIFEPFNRAKPVNFIFPSLTLDDSHLNAVSSFKYQSHIVSALTSDNDDILHQMSFYCMLEQICQFVNLVSVVEI